MRNFQLIVLGIFILFGVVAVLIFSGAFGGKSGGDGGMISRPVLVWGTISMDKIERTLGQVLRTDPTFSFNYIEKRDETFEQEFLEALASGIGPDLVIIPHDLYFRHRDKFLTIPKENLPERTFRDTFVAGSEIFLSSEGAVALPFYIDPLVMYWNRPLLSSAGIATVPRSWVEFRLLPEKLTKKDSRENLIQSAVALGGYNNISHAKEILSAMLMQTGDAIVTREGDGYKSVLGLTGTAADSALVFYTDFSNEAKSSYSWNPSLPVSIDAFAGGTLAFYFGLASEAERLRVRNPHLDFDVAPLPQTRDSTIRMTYGKIGGVFIVKNGTNLTGSYNVAYKIVFGEFARELTTFGVVPARRDLLSVQSEDPFRPVFYDGALISKAWVDPNPKESDRIFHDMIEGIVIGKETVSDSLSMAREALARILRAR